MTSAARFEIADVLTVTYSYHYGAITPFFEALTQPTPAIRITRCAPCDLQFCPPRHHCPQCWEPTTWVDHAGTGTVESVVWAYWIPIDSPARAWTDLPYAYGAIRLDGCDNLLRVRILGLDPTASIPESTGRRGELRVEANATGCLGDLAFHVADDG